MLIEKRERLARLLLGVLIAGILAAAGVCRWHSVVIVDTRTYLEMTAAIVDHGVPSLSNGPADTYPELQARWNRVSDAKLWGTLPPVFPYIAVPAFVLGGIRGVIRFNIALLAALSVACFTLGRRLTRDPLCGTATAYVVMLSTPVWAFSLDVSPYPFSITCITFAMVSCLAALDSAPRRARWFAIATGLLCGLAVGAHLTTLAIAAVIVAAMLLLPAPGAPSLVPVGVGPDFLAEHGPSRESIERGGWTILGAMIPLAAVGWLNHRRFHSWNPLSYGPCAWRSCVETGLHKQSIGFMLEFAQPVIIWAVVTLAALAFVWRNRTARVTTFAIAVLATVPPSLLHDRATTLFSVAWGFMVDVSALDLGGFMRVPDGLGMMLGPYVIKSTLQCTPILALALFARGLDQRTQRAVAVLGLAVAALYGVIALRANLPVAFALGFPFLHLRYTTPALPLFVALAIMAMRELPFRWWHVVVCVVVAVALTAWFLHASDDWSHPRRVVILRVTLALAATMVVMYARGRSSGDRFAAHLAAVIAAVGLGVGVAETLGIDCKAMIEVRNSNDAQLDAVTPHLPARFALVGWPREIDTVLALRAGRDIEYADMFESQNWANFRTLIDRWSGARRPIYALFPNDMRFNSPWPDVQFELLDPVHGLYRIEKF